MTGTYIQIDRDLKIVKNLIYANEAHEIGEAILQTTHFYNSKF